MKLKAPPGVGDPCVAGVAITSRDGTYEVEPEIGALLIEAFGFVPVGANEKQNGAPPAGKPSRPASEAKPKLVHPAWRTRPVVKKA